MKKARFVRVDVFAEKRFGGNPLAVFPEAEGLESPEMQLLAKEMNLSETTFVLPPSKGSGADFRVRIFVPDMEIPYAGHPTLGTFYVLAKEGRIRLKEPVTTVLMECGAGVLPVEIYSKRGKVTKVVTVQNKPKFMKEFDDYGIFAESLSLSESDFAVGKAPVALVSTGLPWVMMLAKNRKVVEEAKGNASAFAEAIKLLPKNIVDIYITCLEPLFKTSTTHSRGFSLVSGAVVEDPATGSASGDLGGYLTHYGVVPMARKIDIVNEQGYEIGRPSKIFIEVRTDGAGQIEPVRVGGQIVDMMDGTAYV